MVDSANLLLLMSVAFQWSLNVPLAFFVGMLLPPGSMP
jgi:hypothetical protein